MDSTPTTHKSVLKLHSLRRRRDFALLRRRGTVYVGRILVLSILPSPDGQTRLGIIVGKKYERRAVKRNRARRIIREAFRLLPEQPSPIWVVIIARRFLATAKMPDCQRELSYLLRKAQTAQLKKS